MRYVELGGGGLVKNCYLTPTPLQVAIKYNMDVELGTENRDWSRGARLARDDECVLIDGEINTSADQSLGEQIINENLYRVR